MNKIFKSLSIHNKSIAEQVLKSPCRGDLGGPMKKLVAIVLVLSFFTVQLRADEGMWLTKDITRNIKQMKKAGLKLSAADIYSINKACLKDAVIGLSNADNAFDSFATASFVSDSGLLITNFHPIIRYLEQFSQPGRDFIKSGYWSTKPEEETHCRDLSVIQLVKMVDVTTEILEGANGLKSNEYNNKINENGIAIRQKYTRGTDTDAKITSFMGGNQFIMSIYKVYKDVRMVAAPPISLAKFAGDADNWRWPRHAADFAFLRVYVGKDNKPADFSKENVALKGNHFLKVSAAGVKENDFSMIIGYPARTKLYIPSFAIEYLEQTELPAKIKIRGEKLRIINEALKARPEIKFRYTARVNSITNNYLRWKGELNGLKRMKLTQQKLDEEKELMAWINADSARIKKYGDIISVQRDIYNKLIPLKIADIYFNETAISGAELVPFAGKFEKLVQMFNRKKINEKAIKEEVDRLIPLAKQFFESWDKEVDKQMFRDMLFLYYNNVDKAYISNVMVESLAPFDGDLDKYTDYAFANSMLTKPDSIQAFLQKVDTITIDKFTADPLYKIALSYYEVYTRRVLNQTQKLEAEQAKYYNLYMDAIASMNSNKLMFSDANRTQRLSYGKVTGALAADGLLYNYYTTMDGIFEKRADNPGNPDYLIPKKIADLYQNADFGTYAVNGKMPVNFLSNLHTSSANSGSPVLNAKGELIGLNFDRIAEGVASDYKYLPESSRNIAVDIRYVLFLLEKYSMSKQLVNEMVIVK